MTTSNLMGNTAHFIKTYIIQILMVLASVILVLSYDHLPTKKISIFPFPVLSAGVYSDSVNGGNSASEWKPDINPKAFSCTLKEGLDYPFCGMIFNFNFGKYQSTSDTIDLTVYDSINIHVRASDNVTAVRLNMRNLNDLFYSINDINSTMFMSTMLTPNDLNKDITIDLNQFRVAQWWLEQYNVPRQHWSPQMDKIRTLAVEITHENAFNIEHTLEIKYITFTGKVISKANWYLTIMAVWLLYALYYVTHSARQFIKQVKRDKALVEHLQNTHKRLNQEYSAEQYNAMYDPLTKVLNRQGFEDKLNILDSLNSSNADDKDPNAIIYINIDDFKQVNEDYSHSTGDSLLKECVDIISSEVRDDDLLCRWSGDEFVLLCPKASSVQGFAIAEKIRVTLSNTPFCSPDDLKITASFGVASCASIQQFKAAMHNADEALFKAKRDGKNRTMISD